MTSNVMRYKGYVAEIGYDDSADAFHGRVVGVRDVIDFYGRTPEELRAEFKAAVEAYLAWCAEEGHKPEKPGPASGPSVRSRSSAAVSRWPPRRGG